jgi:hypothetical protein
VGATIGPDPSPCVSCATFFPAGDGKLALCVPVLVAAVVEVGFVPGELPQPARTATARAAPRQVDAFVCSGMCPEKSYAVALKLR